MGVPNLTGAATNAALVIDRDGFERLAEPLVPVLRLHCYRLVGSLEDAEDMVQETLVRAWRNRDRLRDEAGARPWLFRIATNACLDLLDRKRRRPTATLDDPHQKSVLLAGEQQVPLARRVIDDQLKRLAGQSQLDCDAVPAWPHRHGAGEHSLGDVGNDEFVRIRTVGSHLVGSR